MILQPPSEVPRHSILSLIALVPSLLLDEASAMDQLVRQWHSCVLDRWHEGERERERHEKSCSLGESHHSILAMPPDLKTILAKTKAPKPVSQWDTFTALQKYTIDTS